MSDLSYPNSGAYRYRPLKRGLHGCDVYALQSAIDTTPDGWFGDKTASAVREAQKEVGVAVDGIAGIITQRAVGAVAVRVTAKDIGVPYELLYGQVEAECGWQLGNYSAQRTDGSRDRGIVQENSNYYPSATGAFHVVTALHVCARAMHDRYTRYTKLSGSERWLVAAAAWNNPAAADLRASGGPLKAALADYMERIGAYFV